MDQAGHQLITELLADPRAFSESGRAYQLLQAYFAGFPIESLRGLLTHKDTFVQRSAAFVASELGRDAVSLVDDVIPLVRSHDRRIQWDAMEVLAVCCEAENAWKFVHVVKMLENSDPALRGLAMFLVSNADISQLTSVRKSLDTSTNSEDRLHARALHALAAGDSVAPSEIEEMMRNDNALVRRYGAIAARRVAKRFPQLIANAKISEDEDVRQFYETHTELEQV